MSNMSSLNSNSNNIENIKKERRKLENDMDTKLSQLSSLNDKVNRDDCYDTLGDNKIEFSLLTSELDTAFKNLTRCNELLADDPNINQSKIHREKLDDFLQDYRKLKKNITSILERTELFSGSYNNNKNGDAEIPMGNLLREHSTLQGSSFLTDSILGQARQAHEALENQRRILRGARDKINTMPNLFTSIDNITSKIKRLKRRNLLILGFLIGTCICFILYYSFL
ncbi:hypothetical protein DLAC_03255 [Tieghemostelium lacteum]|uniref:Golgi SNAP receptor complex member 1 n=1 Tax=Tieghemostelium lacteum TaxID=361077 RepID=A0A152A1K3_TIELA|nr:hypothetical protein DLAC_03255 [Tieghemostelium lacteum]|eukprot:KYR00106.1 hypothetical protein DLAC_03255 [Tieghemostelium lacteum]